MRFSNVYGSTADNLTGWCRRLRAPRARARRCTYAVVAWCSTHPGGRQRDRYDAAAAGPACGRAQPAAGSFRHRPSNQALAQLAEIANKAGGHRSAIIEAPVRSNDVMTFVGNSTRAEQLLGWRATVAIEDGVRQLVDDFACPELESLASLLHQPARRAPAQPEPVWA